MKEKVKGIEMIRLHHKKPKAIYDYSDKYDCYTWHCSMCKMEVADHHDMAFPYCPYCGVKLLNGGKTLQIPKAIRDRCKQI